MAQLLMGYKPGTLSRGNGEATTGWSRVTYLGKTTQPLWVQRGGVRMGRNQSGTAWAAPVLYSGPNSGDVDTLVARTNTLALTAYMDGSSRSGGANYEAAVQTPVLIPAGTHLFGGFWVSSGDIGYGQDLSGAMMYKTVPPQGHGGSPNNPWNQSSQANEGNIDTWWVFDTNETPGAPTPIEPAAGAMTSDQSPDIKIGFNDANVGDSVKSWLIELWSENNTTQYYSSGVVNAPTGVSGTTITWNPGTITARKYTVRAYTWDQGGAKSSAGIWTFTVNAGGTPTSIVLTPGVGTKSNGDTVYNDTTPNSVTTTWTHQTGESAVEWLWEIQDATTGAVVRAVAQAFPTTPSGSQQVLGWHGGWAALPAGTTRYRWHIWAYDALGGRSADGYSPVFVINAQPGYSAQTPASGATRSNTNLGSLQYTVTDPGDVAGSHAGSFDISSNGGTTWLRYAGTHLGGGVYRLDLTSAHIPGNGTYVWREYVIDPWGLGGAGSWKTLNIVDPPALSSLAPAGTIAVGTPTISATVDRTVATYRVVVRTASGALVMDTEDVAGSGSTISVPVPAGLLRNKTDYVTTYSGTASDGLTFSAAQAWRLEYIPKQHLSGVAVELVRSSVFDAGEYPQLPNADVLWDAIATSVVSETDFIGYVVYRYDGEGKGREWLVRNRSVVGLTDRSAGHGVHDWYVGYRYYENAGADTVESELVKVSTNIVIRHATVTTESGDTAATLKYWRDRQAPQVIHAEVRVPLGRKKPFGFQSQTDYDLISGAFEPLSAEDGVYDAHQLVEAMKTLAAPTILADGSSGPQELWWRDPYRTMRFMFTQGIGAADGWSADAAEIDVAGSEVESTVIVPMVEPLATVDMTGKLEPETVVPLNASLAGRDVNGPITATATGAVRWRSGIKDVPAAINIIPNPLFDGDASGWSSGYFAKVGVDGETDTGAPAYRLYANSSGGTGYVQVTTPVGAGDIVPGATYTIWFKARGSRAGIKMGGQITWKDSGGVTIGAAQYDPGATTIISGTGWTQVSLTRAAPAGAVSAIALLRVELSSYDIGDTIWIGEPQFERGSTPTPFLHGSMGSGWSWKGTANNSTSIRTATAVDAAALIEEGTTNILLNPSVETNTTSVTSLQSAAITRVTDMAYIGTASARVVTPGTVAGEGVAFWSASSLGITGSAQSYIAQAAVKGPAGATVKFDVQVNYVGNINAFSTSVTHTFTGDWTVVASNIITTDPTKTVNFIALLIRTDVAQAITFWADAAQLENRTYITSYADGSLGTGYAWTGTAHASTSTRANSVVEAPLPAGVSIDDILASGTIVLRVRRNGSTGGMGVLGGYTNRRFSMGSDGELNFYSGPGGSYDASPGLPSLAVGQWATVAVRWTNGQARLSFNTQHGAWFPIRTGNGALGSALYLGGLGAAAQFTNVAIGGAVTFPEAISDTELEQIVADSESWAWDAFAAD